MSQDFRRGAGACAVLAAAAGLVFTVAFAVVVQEGDRWAAWVSWTSLLVGGLVTIPVMVALYATLGAAELQFALVGLVLGVAGAIGAALHGAFELGVLAQPPSASGSGGSGAPLTVDPRGFMTFAVTALALLVFGWLMLRAGHQPEALGWLAVAGAVLLLVVYVGRLSVLNPKNDLIRAPALLSGLVVLPAFYLLLGRTLLQPRPPTAATG